MRIDKFYKCRMCSNLRSVLFYDAADNNYVAGRCWAVLDIVPQTVEDDCLENSAISFTSSFLRSNESTSTAAGICYGEMSLERYGSVC